MPSLTTVSSEEAGLARLRNAERDIDRIILEHFHCSPDFRNWLLGASGLGAADEAELVLESVRGGQRTDHGIDLLLSAPRLRSAVAIANRLVPSQRLAEAARRAVIDETVGGPLKIVRLMLLRPEAVVSRSTETDRLFDAVITHDWLKVLFEARAMASGGELARRLDYHAQTLSQAIALAEEAVTSMPEQSLDDFMVDYLAILRREAPTIPDGAVLIEQQGSMDQPIVVFPPAALPHWSFLPGMRLAHHTREGAVSLSFSGWGPSLPDLAQLMEPVLSRTPYYLALGRKPTDDGLQALMIVEDVPAVNIQRPVRQQEAAVVAAVRAADALRRWFESQRAPVRYWAELAGSGGGESRINRFRREVTLS
jgi:hypothetical protein